jgi:putative phosphoribosyl transferase
MVAEFIDREDAGKRLTDALISFRGTNTVVLALPRGGLPVAEEVASGLGLPLEVLIVRKLGVPGNEEFAFGAISEADAVFIDADTVQSVGISASDIAACVEFESQQLIDRVQKFRGSSKRADLTGRTALIVDDGLATGATATAATLAARRLGAMRVVVAVPVAPIGITSVQLGCDELVSVIQPPNFRAVGSHYQHFDQVSDNQAASILAAAQRGAS